MESTIKSENPEGIFIYSTHPIPPLKDVPALIKQSDPTPVHEVTQFDLLKQSLREMHCGCVVFDVKDADHLKQLAELSHAMRSEISAGVFQFVVLCQLQHPKLEAFLDKLNCNKVLYPPYTAKGLKIAVTRHMTIARKAANADSDSGARPLKLTGSDAARRASQNAYQRQVRETDPLTVLDDCWLTKASVAKSIHGKWLCFAIGPGPVTGVWTEVRVEGGGRRFDDRVWEWTPKDPINDLFIREGVWRFRGRLPEFKDTSWAFVGTSPELGYYKNGVLIERKILTESNGDLIFAKNSKAALEKLPDIQASIDFEVYMRREGGKGGLLEYVEKRRKERDLMASVETEDAKMLELQLEKELERASKDFTSRESLQDPEDFKDSSSSSEPPFNGGKFGKKSVEPARIATFQKAEPLFKSRTRLFQLIPSDTGIHSRILEACRWQCPVIFWTAKRQIKELSSVVSGDSDGEMIRIAYPKAMKKAQIQNELRAKSARRLYVNINTRRTAIFFAQELDAVSFNDESIDVEVPSVVYEVQRREYLRYSFTPETATSVLIGLESSQNFAIQGFAKDVSVGGIQVASIPTDAKALKRARGLEPGVVFPNVTFELYGKTIHCSAQLRWKKEDAGTILLGLQFVKISPEDREGIRLFVMEESFDYIESILNAAEEPGEGPDEKSNEEAAALTSN